MILPHSARLALYAMLAPQLMREPDFIIGAAADPYLYRWHLSPRGDQPAAYLHHFMRSDDDRALHDHPYESTSVILSGQYIEWTEGGRSELRQEGAIVSRSAETAHRVELLLDAAGQPLPVTTLFLCGPRVREWGFHCPQGWRPWQQFVAERDAGDIGVGCG